MLLARHPASLAHARVQLFGVDGQMQSYGAVRGGLHVTLDACDAVVRGHDLHEGVDAIASLQVHEDDVVVPYEHLGLMNRIVDASENASQQMRRGCGPGAKGEHGLKAHLSTVPLRSR